MAVKIRRNKILSRISMTIMMMFYTAITNTRTCSTFSSVQLMHYVASALSTSSSSSPSSLRIMNPLPRYSNSYSYSTIISSKRMISSSSINISSSSSSEDKDDNNNNHIHIRLETSTSSSSDSDSIESSSSSSSPSDPESIIPTSKTIVANNGEILRTALLRNGISPHNGKSRLINCRGLGTCGTCAIEIYNTGTNDRASDTNNNIEPKERNTKEKLRLNFPPHNLSSNQSPNLRLACQVQVQVNNDDIGGEIMVKKRKGFWGQGTMMKQKDDDSSIIQKQEQQQQQDGVVVADDDDYKEFDKAELWFGELEYILDNKSPPPSPPSPPSSTRSSSSSTLSSSSSNSYNNSS